MSFLSPVYHLGLTKVVSFSFRFLVFQKPKIRKSLKFRLLVFFNFHILFSGKCKFKLFFKLVRLNQQFYTIQYNTKFVKRHVSVASEVCVVNAAVKFPT